MGKPAPYTFERVPFRNVVLGAVFRHEGAPIQKIDEPVISKKSMESFVVDGDNLVNHYKNSYNCYSTNTKGAFNLHPDTIVEVGHRGVKSPKWRT